MDFQNKILSSVSIKQIGAKGFDRKYKENRMTFEVKLLDEEVKDTDSSHSAK